jgi:hypothetical protein
MSDHQKSTVYWNPEGYIEIIFVGVQSPEDLRTMDREAREIIADHDGNASLLIDARRGRIGRDAASFSVVMKLSRERRLNRFIVLVDEKPQHPDAGRETGVIISMLTAAFGKRPIYIYDEAAARALAASE